MKSRFHEDAETDLTKAIEYYDRANPGLGDRLLAEVRAAVGYIEQFPRSAAILAEDIHGKVLVRFPHSLLYVIERDELVVLAVAHQSQDVEAWLTIIGARRSNS